MTNRCTQLDVNAVCAYITYLFGKKIIIILITVRNYPEKNVCSSKTVCKNIQKRNRGSKYIER